MILILATRTLIAPELHKITVVLVKSAKNDVKLSRWLYLLRVNDEII